MSTRRTVPCVPGETWVRWIFLRFVDFMGRFVGFVLGFVGFMGRSLDYRFNDFDSFVCSRELFIGLNLCYTVTG